jgi:flagellar assembly factor FliW
MVISFRDGINDSPGPGGFVVLGLKRFSPFLVLVSEKKPHVSYPIIDPRTVVPDYRPHIHPEELRTIGNPEIEAMQVVSVVELDGERKVAFLDLRHPILINVKGRVGKQIQVDCYPERLEIPAALLRQ